ncbi:MAG: SprT-like domain-containing protein, partial [Chloroflexota bacterium]|nr:SprT-like domain-containing protein [Chloroflexota bacterium]
VYKASGDSRPHSTAGFRFTPISAEAAEERRRRLHTVAATARELMDLHGLSDWTLVYGESRRQLGLCKHRDQVIRIALHHALDDGADDIRNTVLHEIAHALAGPGAGHGAKWKEIAARIGATPAAARYEKSAATRSVDSEEPEITM